MKYKTQLQTAALNWRDDDSPFSNQFQDIYFSSGDGLAEARHVFIEGNDLASRWADLTEGQAFTIFECGFGCGLNFLATVTEWQRLRPQGKLHYYAFEGFPFKQEDLTRAISAFADEINGLSQFANLYPQMLDQRPVKYQDDITIQLILCDATEMAKAENVSYPFDAIFMDGFSPALNPAMWSLELCQYLYDRSASDSTLTTYSVAGIVKRNLKSAGFYIAKRQGHGRKREMLVAYKAAN